MNSTVTYTPIQDNIHLIKQLIQEGHYTQALEECSANLENESSFDDFNLSSQLYTYRALAYYKISRFEEALSDATQALESLKKCSKEMKDTKIKLFLVFGKVYTSRADYKDALKILNEGLGLAKDFTGADSLDSARYHCSIGRVYTEIGEETQATEHLDQCSNILSKNQENKEYNHEIVSYNYASGKLCEYQRRLKTGMDIYTRACEILLSLYSVNHPDLFPVYCGLGNCCFGQEDYTSAKEWYVKALEIAQKNFPDKHLTYSVCYYSFGNIYLEKGIYNSAEEFYNQALEIKENYFAHLQHPDIAKLKFNLSIIYLEQNKLTKALEVLEHAESIFIEKFKQDHKLSVKCLHSKAKIFETQGKFGLAFPIFKQALAKYKLIYASDEIEIGECYISIGKILYEQWKYKEAVNNYFEGLRIIQKVLGPHSFNAGRILFNIGLCLLMLKNYESGEKMFIRANQICRGKTSPEKNPEEALLTERIDRRLQSLSLHTLKLAPSIQKMI